ncbi:hypothetical protein Q4519_21610 [Motilimonas sp. 1_MG-2023]|uniref:hypothetical protein n=1 Tax=Motilimonas sp. 1_MG-2023 TaxID=3062672 RepID=UPI0026E43451|nr:hypothetical protein [Motilimonas sp. 1_MG-2023]MDO6528255.1 hypothetical protein [Motilimonas sp. 1_MG-2023]
MNIKIASAPLLLLSLYFSPNAIALEASAELVRKMESAEKYYAATIQPIAKADLELMQSDRETQLALLTDIRDNRLDNNAEALLKNNELIPSCYEALPKSKAQKLKPLAEIVQQFNKAKVIENELRASLSLVEKSEQAIEDSLGNIHRYTYESSGIVSSMMACSMKLKMHVLLSKQ